MSNSGESLGINLFVANNLRRQTSVKPGGETVQQFEHKTPPSPLPKKEEDPVVDPLIKKPIKIEDPPKKDPIGVDPKLILPITEPSKIKDPPKKDPIGVDPVVDPPEPPPPTELTVALVGLQNALARETQDVAETYKAWEQTDSLKNTTRGKIASAIMKMPVLGKFLGGAVFNLSHPLKTTWQNMLMSGLFDKRNERFAREMTLALKDQDLQMAHVELPQEFVAYALAEGRWRRNKTPLTRLGNSLWDLTVGNLSFQDSTQRETLNYLRSPDSEKLKAKLSGLVNESLERQGRLANGITEHLDRAGKENDLVVAREFGERRELLNLEPGAQQQLSSWYRELITQYHDQPENKKQLVSKINARLAQESFQKLLTEEQRAYFNQPEFATNILVLAEQVHQEWDKYQQPDSRENHTGSYFDNLEFKVVVGQTEWHEAREKLRVSPREQAILLELTRRNFPQGAGTVEQAMDWRQRNAGFFDNSLQRILTNPLNAYLAGEVLSAIPQIITVGVSRNLLLQHIPGPFFAGAMGAYSEGKQIVKERQQVSREAAQGFHSENSRQRRAELEKTLVRSRSAQELYNNIKGLLTQESLSENDKQTLLVHLAQAQSRLRLSNLTTLKDRVQQNFLDYSEEHNQELSEYCRQHHLTPERVLRSALIHAQEKLLTNGVSTEKMALYADVTMAQLLSGATEGAKVSDSLKKLTKQYGLESDLATHNQPTQSELDEAIALMVKHNLTVTEAESLMAKNRAFQKYTLWQMAKAGVKTGIMSYAFSPYLAMINPVTALTGEISGMVHGEYADTWQHLVDGDYHPTFNSETGRLESDLSGLQHSYLLLDNVAHGEIPFEGETTAQITVDGQNLELHLNGINTPLRFDSQGNVVDLRDHTVVAQNTSNGLVPVAAVWDQRVESFEVTPGTQGVEIAFPAGSPTHEQTLEINGHIVNIEVPNGTLLVPDTESGERTFDLRDSSGHLLVDNLQFDEEGHRLEGKGWAAPGLTGNLYTLENEAPVAHETSESVSQSTTEHIDGQGFWEDQAQENLRVVHGRSHQPLPMTNYLIKTDNPQEFGVEFRIPDSVVHNPNTGADVSLAEMHSQGKLGIVFQTVEVDAAGHETTHSVFLAAEPTTDVQNGQKFYKVVLNPTDTDPEHQKVAGLVLNQEFLKQQAKSVQFGDNNIGALNSELSVESREAFALGHQQVGNRFYDGRILGGFKSDEAFIANHAIHGSAPLQDAEITVETPEIAPPEPVAPPPAAEEIDYKLDLTGRFVIPGESGVANISARSIDRAFPPIAGLWTARTNLELGIRGQGEAQNVATQSDPPHSSPPTPSSSTQSTLPSSVPPTPTSSTPSSNSQFNSKEKNFVELELQYQNLVQERDEMLKQLDILNSAYTPGQETKEIDDLINNLNRHQELVNFVEELLNIEQSKLVIPPLAAKGD